MMATPLAKEWRTFTQQDPNLPDLKALQKFVKVRKTMASAAIPFAPNNKFDKAEKVNKPKQNPCPKKNSLRIERTSKTADKTSSNRIDGCPECGDKHYLFACQQFRDSTVSHRLDVTKDNHLCFNCLSPSHRVCDCYSHKRCKGKHHSLLHEEASNNQSNSSSHQQPSTPESVIDVKAIRPRKTPQHYASIPFKAIGLAISGRHHCKVRAQINTGAGVSLVTARVANALQAKKFKGTKLTITGYGGALTHSSYSRG